MLKDRSSLVDRCLSHRKSALVSALVVLLGLVGVPRPAAATTTISPVHIDVSGQSLALQTPDEQLIRCTMRWSYSFDGFRDLTTGAISGTWVHEASITCNGPMQELGVAQELSYLGSTVSTDANTCSLTTEGLNCTFVLAASTYTCGFCNGTWELTSFYRSVLLPGRFWEEPDPEPGWACEVDNDPANLGSELSCIHATTIPLV